MVLGVCVRTMCQASISVSPLLTAASRKKNSRFGEFVLFICVCECTVRSSVASPALANTHTHPPKRLRSCIKALRDEWIANSLFRNVFVQTYSSTLTFRQFFVYFSHSNEFFLLLSPCHGEFCNTLFTSHYLYKFFFLLLLIPSVPPLKINKTRKKKLISRRSKFWCLCGDAVCSRCVHIIIDKK